MAEERRKFHPNDLMPNTTQVPNVLFDRIMPAAPEATFKCLMAVARQTYGWRKEWDALSTSRLEQLTGLSNRTVIDHMEHLRGADLVKRRTGENREYGMEYSLNLNCDFDKAVAFLQQLGKKRPPRLKPSGGRKKAKEGHESGSQPPMNPSQGYEPDAVPMGFIATHESGSQEPMNGNHTQKPTIKTNYQNQGGKQQAPSQLALSPSVALIAQQRFMERIGDSWRKAEAEASEPNQARNLFITVRMSAKQAGLDYALAKIFLSDHPGWFDWPYLNDLDSQQEISFPDPPKPQPQSAAKEAPWWEGRLSQERYEKAKSKALEYLAVKAAGKSTEHVRYELGAALGTTNADGIAEFIESIQQLEQTA